MPAFCFSPMRRCTLDPPRGAGAIHVGACHHSTTRALRRGACPQNGGNQTLAGRAGARKQECHSSGNVRRHAVANPTGECAQFDVAEEVVRSLVAAAEQGLTHLIWW